MTVLRNLKPAILPVAALMAGLAIAACSMGGGSTPIALSPGLSARMDQPGASLDRAQAIDMINAYRATRNMPPLMADAGLNGTAQALANQYARTGTAPTKPQNLAQMKLSAGYATFAETFSGWRNNAADAVGLAAPATKAGVAAAYNPGSSYGIYWVLVLGN